MHLMQLHQLALCLCSIGLALNIAQSADYGTARYSGVGFSHMELYSLNGSEYAIVGQTNRLVRLSSDFSKSNITVLGPLNDSETCMPHQVHQDMPNCEVKPTDNHVRAMYIRDGQLYFCMSFLSGSCSRVQLAPPDRPLIVDTNAIAVKLKDSVRGLLCRNPEANILMTVDERGTRDEGTIPDAIYLSMPYCVSKFDKIEPTLSVVDLRTLQPFAVADSSLSNFQTEVVPQSRKIRPGTLKHHLSFARRSSPRNCSCVYFLLTASSEEPKDATRIRIGRLCAADLYMSRYAEIYLDCGYAGSGGASYAGEAATVAKPGKHLAAALNITTEDDNSDVLFLTSRVRDDVSRSGNHREGICAIPLTDIDRQLDDVLADCRRGDAKAVRGPSYLRVVNPCFASSSQSPTSCAQSSESRQITWEGAFSRRPERANRAPFLVERPSKQNEDSGSDNYDVITSLAAVRTERGDTALYAGTSLGRLLGYRLPTKRSSRGRNVSFASMVVGPDVKQITPVLAVRTGVDRIFTLTESEVASHPYANCERQFFTCSTCLNSNNPHCVWSNLGDGCVTWKPSRAVSPLDEASLDHVINPARCALIVATRDSEVNLDLTASSPSSAHSVTMTVRHAPRVQSLRCLLLDQSQGRSVIVGPVEPAVASSNGVDNDVTDSVLKCNLQTAALRENLRNRTSKQLILRLTTSAADITADASYLASVNILTFSCGLHSTCSQCASQRPRCVWCITAGVCASECNKHETYDGASDPTVQTVVSDSQLCPAVHLLDSGGGLTPSADELVVPAGVAGKQRLVYSVLGLQTYMRSFYCIVSCPNSTSVTFPADLADSGRRLVCRTANRPPLELAYNHRQANVTCAVDFHWSTSSSGTESPPERKKLDTVGGASRLILYSCRALAQECDACALRTPAELDCVWCDGGGDSSGGFCASSGGCGDNPRLVVVGHGGLCANPRLTDIRPAKLTARPGLRLSVSGANLGNQADSLSARLVPVDSGSSDLRSLECRLLQDSYQPGRAFDCRVAEAPSEAEIASAGYQLEVTLLGLSLSNRSGKVLSRPLAVRTPTVTSVVTSTVQQRGRATVRLLGRNLDAGSDLRVNWRRIGSIDNGTSAEDTVAATTETSEVLERRSDGLTLRLGSFSTTGRYRPELTVQDWRVPAKNAEIGDLMVVTDAQPTVTEADQRAGLIPAGGLAFVVAGDGLGAVQNALMRFVEIPANVTTTTTLEAPCRLFTDGEQQQQQQRLICLSPTVPSRRVRRNVAVGAPDAPRRFSASIELDSLVHPYPVILTLRPNPQFDPLPPSLTISVTDIESASGGIWRELQLLGRSLSPVVLPSDIRMTVGLAVCQTLSLRPAANEAGDEVATCRFLMAGDALNQALPVRVSVGLLNFDLGYVTYASEFPYSIYVYIGLGVGSVLLFAAALAGCLHVHQRSRKRRDKVNGIEVHLVNLEAQVAINCRAAFAELQLNSSPETSCVDPAASAPPPVRSFSQFASYSCFAERYRDRFKTNDCLFSDVATEEIASGQDSPEVRKALGQLGNLLLNEDFILTMIAALESRTDRFMHQERNHFGSLVSAFLFVDPAYFTRVLTGLVNRLIARKNEAHENYKVTFRRCDSVAERLLPNWLAFLMYEHLAEHVAEPLFRLHREMRLQIYRGPVDQVTEDSRYTINEQKLLKKEIPFKVLTLSFHDRLRIFGGEGQPLHCKVTVLDCDTVHQAKDKILDAVYCRLGVPASQRMSATQFDLVRVAASQGDREFEDTNASDTADSLQRLRRLSCLNLCDKPGGSGPYWVYLRPRKPASSSIESTRRGLSKGASYADIGSLPGGTSSKSLQDMKHFSNSYSRIAVSSGSPRQYHLLQPSNASQHTLDRGNKKRRMGKKAKQMDGDADNQPIVSEVLFPILLSTKKNLVEKITDLFKALFPTIQQPTQMQSDDQQQPQTSKSADTPPCLTYLFALIDKMASDKGDESAEIAHVWKSNALMLRFYTHHLLNVEYLLDVDVPGPIRYCMSTVSTLFMDACSVEPPKKPDKTSTAQRLLFYSEIADLHARVEAFYSAARASAKTPNSWAMDNFTPSGDCRPFNSGPLLKELFTCFVFKYYDDIVRQLQQQQPCVSDSLIASLQSVMLVLGSESPQQQQHTMQHHQPHQFHLMNSGTRDRKKRSNSRPALDSNAYDF